MNIEYHGGTHQRRPASGSAAQAGFISTQKRWAYIECGCKNTSQRKRAAFPVAYSASFCSLPQFMLLLHGRWLSMLFPKSFLAQSWNTLMVLNEEYSPSFPQTEDQLFAAIAVPRYIDEIYITESIRSQPPSSPTPSFCTKRTFGYLLRYRLATEQTSMDEESRIRQSSSGFLYLLPSWLAQHSTVIANTMKTTVAFSVAESAVTVAASASRHFNWLWR